MPSHPTLFDDDEPGAPGRAVVGGRSGADASAASADTGGTNGPNYLARRAIVVGAVVAAIALAAIGIGRLIGGGDGDGASGAVNADWNRVVLFDARRGELNLLRDDGEEAATYRSGIRNADGYGVVDATAVVANDAATAIVDLRNGDMTEHELGSASVATPAGTISTLLAPTSDALRGLLVHGPSGEVIDTAEYAPVAGATYDFARAVSSPSGRHVLITDTGNFQSVLFSFDREEPSYFPGLALAVDGNTVVTAQNVGDRATISVFDHAGNPTSSAQTETVRAAMLTDESVVLVTVEGSIVTMDLDSGETEAGIPLAVGTVASGTVMPSGDRLIVAGADGTRVIDPDGNAIGAYAGQAPLTDRGALRGATCITLVGPAESGVTVVDVRTGAPGERIDIDPVAVSRSADGCTVAVETTDGITLVTTAGVAGSFDGRLLALAPDATRLVVDDGGALRLVPTEDETDEDADDLAPVELGRSGPAVAFTEV